MVRSLKEFFARKYSCIEERPFFDSDLNELKELYYKAISLEDNDRLCAIVWELKFRKTPDSQNLLREVKHSMELLNESPTEKFSDRSFVKGININKEASLKNKEEKPGENNGLTQFVSFYKLVEDLVQSDKPENLIDSPTWEMFCKSLKNDDIQYTLLSDFAEKIGGIWPDTGKEDISDYLDIDFDKLKKNFGWNQKRVIISAVATASYAKIKSWRVLKKVYGTNDYDEEFFPEKVVGESSSTVAAKESSNCESQNNGDDGMKAQSDRDRITPIDNEKVSIKSSIDEIIEDFGL